VGDFARAIFAIKLVGLRRADESRYGGPARHIVFDYATGRQSASPRKAAITSAASLMD
jgi:hypothetical protein